VPGFNTVGFRAELQRDDDGGENGETGRDQERQAVAVHQGAAVAGGGRRGGGGEDRQPDRGTGLLAGGEQRPGQSLVAGEGIPRRVVCEVGDWELFLELVSAGVGIGFAPIGLQYPVLTAPDSVLRLIPVEGVRLERHIYLILPSVGETSPAARRFADQLLRLHPAGS
jgi:DNA-binding transcriptional LysR family regulator